MGEHSAVGIVVVAGENDFGEDVAFIAIVLQGSFGAEVVEAIGFGAAVVIGQLAVAVDYLVAILDELEGDVARGLNGEVVLRGDYQLHQLHQGRLTAAYWAS